MRYSADQKRWKYSILIGGGIVLAACVAYFSMYAPAVRKDQVQGAIAKRDVYRDPNAQAATGPVDAGAGDAEFQQLYAVGQFKRLAGDANFRALAADPDFAKLMANSQFVGLMADTGLLARLVRSTADLRASSNAAELTKARAETAAELTKAHADLKAESSAAELAKTHPVDLATEAQISRLLSGSKFEALATNAHFQSLVRSASFQALAQNADFRALVANSNFRAIAQSAKLESQFQSAAAGLRNP